MSFCEACDEYASLDDAQCENCDARLCAECAEFENLLPFEYEGRVYCFSCRPDQPPEVTSEILLMEALRQLDVSWLMFKHHFILDNPMYSTPQNMYTCPLDHACGNTECENIGVSYRNEQGRLARGRCCVAAGLETRCDACTQ